MSATSETPRGLPRFDRGVVVSVSAHPEHAFSKRPLPEIQLLTGLGVEGDAHCGRTVKHRSRVAKDPTQPNLRQVHLIADEFLEYVAGLGFTAGPADLGENVLTRGLALRCLPAGSRLRFGDGGVIEITGLRNPCKQLDHFQPGLLAASLGRDAEGRLIRKAGVMGVVSRAGPVRPGDEIEVELPAPPYRELERV
jgi:MOSC domain-containing protein YiiM